MLLDMLLDVLRHLRQDRSTSIAHPPPFVFKFGPPRHVGAGRGGAWLAQDWGQRSGLEERLWGERAGGEGGEKGDQWAEGQGWEQG